MTEIEGERSKLIRIFVADINGDPTGKPVFETDERAEALAFHWPADKRYRISVGRRFMSKTEFEQLTT
jgi:hypothetical protein